MGLFGGRNKRNKYDIKVLYAGRTDVFQGVDILSDGGEDLFKKIREENDPMTKGIPLDVLQAAFSGLYASILKSGMKLNDSKMVDRNVAGIYQTILYPVDGGKIEFMYDGRSKHGTADFWIDLSCDLDMTRDVFISAILQPVLDELKENGLRFNIKN